MFFFFIFIPCSLLYLALTIMGINFLAKGISLVNLSSGASAANNKRKGVYAIVFSLSGLLLISWLYWKYAWIW